MEPLPPPVATVMPFVSALGQYLMMRSTGAVPRTVTPAEATGVNTTLYPNPNPSRTTPADGGVRG